MTQPPNRPPFALVVVVLAVIVGVVVLIRMGGGGGGEPEPTPPSSIATRPPRTDAPVIPLEGDLPACARGEQPATDPDATPDAWATVLVDPALMLPADYEPADLESVAPAGFIGEFVVRGLIIKDLKKLNKAAGDEGIDLGIAAAYRSYAEQEELFQTRLELGGRDQALQGTARPGHSEHQLGTTVDFRDAAAPDVTKSWGSEPGGMWMEEHAWEYGFVLSYPRNREDVTCYQYEPWHFRYVGRDIASQVQASGLTLREWLWNQQTAGI